MHQWQPSASISTIRLRAEFYRDIRQFFYQLDYLEVDTPLLSEAAVTDVNIDSISALNGSQKAYLQTSPEFFMKRLLAAGLGSCYQISHAFRAGELGRCHNPEFTLLEWYGVGLDYQRLMDQIEKLIMLLLPNQASNFERVSYGQIFLQHLGIDIFSLTLTQLQQAVDQAEIGADAASYSFDECLDLLLSEVISPKFKGFTFIYDYPRSQASLARLKKDNHAVAERFELFYQGLELANGFSELTDETEQRQRFDNDNQIRKAQNKTQSSVDERFLGALKHGMPQSAGVAIGLDRLLMVKCGKKSISEVLTFLR